MSSNLKDLVKKNRKYIKEELNLNELLDRFLLQEQNNKVGFSIPAFHPSLISKGVECQLWWYFYLKDSPTKSEEWKDENLTAMVNGTGIHNEWQHVLYRMGMLEGVYKCNTCGHEFWATLYPKDLCPSCHQALKNWNYLTFKEVPIHIGFIRGHADGILNNNGARFLLELKSIKNVDRPNAKYGFEVLNTRPLDDHFIQTQLYLYGWYEIAKKAPLEEEYKIDEDGKLSTEKLDGPVYEGAKIIGVINSGIIEYIAKNSSEKKSFLIKRNTPAIQFLLDEMQIIYKSFLEDSLDGLKGIDQLSKNKCKSCVYRETCTWQ